MHHGQAISRYLEGTVTRRRVTFWASASNAVQVWFRSVLLICRTRIVRTSYNSPCGHDIVQGQEQRRLGALVLERNKVALTDEEAFPALIKVCY